VDHISGEKREEHSALSASGHKIQFKAPKKKYSDNVGWFVEDKSMEGTILWIESAHNFLINIFLI
jgi:ABC-type sugar transport system ATPase subunit